MAQAAPVCCADPSAPRKPPVVSTGLPSPASSPADRPAPPDSAVAPGGASGARGGGASGEQTAAGRPAAAPAGRRWAPSPSFTVRELVLVALGGVFLAVLTTWPL